jgi:hypothetical protein
MSLPDIDYELRDVGQFEYSVGLANASTPEDMEFVASAFRAGELKERKRILSDLEALSDGNGYLSIALFKLRKIINDGNN